MRRLLGAAGFGFFLSLVAAGVFGFNFAVGAAAICLLTTIALLIFLKPQARLSVGIFPFMAFCACVIYCLATIISVNPTIPFRDKNVTFEATVEEIPADPTTLPLKYTVKTNLSGELDKSTRIMLSSLEYIDCLPGDTITVTSHLKEHETPKRFYPSGIFLFGTIKNDSVTVTRNENPSLIHKATRFRHEVAARVMGILPDDEGSIVNAITFGSDFLNNELYALFEYIGVSHLFSVSGLHVGVIGQTTMLLLGFFGVKKRFAALFSAVGVWVFMTIIGFPFSAQRAAVMFTVYTLGMIIFKNADALNSLGLSALLVTLVSPFAALDVGLLSSLSSCLGILVFAKPIRAFILSKLKPGYGKLVFFVVSSVSTTIAATVGILPCSVIFFGSLSLLSPIANLLLIPISYPLLFCSVAGCLFGTIGGIFSGLSSFSYLISGFCAKACRAIATVLSYVPFADLNVSYEYITVWCGMCFFIIAGAVWLFYKNGRRHFCVVCSIICCLAVLVSGVLSHAVFSDRITEIIVCDVGQGYCVAVRKGSDAVIIDNNENSGASKVSSLLKARGISETSLLITGSDTTPEKSKRMKKLCNIKETVSFMRDEISLSPWENFTIEYNKAESAVHLSIGLSTYIITDYNSKPGGQTPEDVVITTSGGAAKIPTDNNYGVFVVSADSVHSAAACSTLSESGNETYYTGGAGSLLISTRGTKDISIRRLKDA